MHTQGLVHPGPLQHSIPLPSSILSRPTQPQQAETQSSQSCQGVSSVTECSVLLCFGVMVLMGPWGVSLASWSIQQTYWQNSLHTSQGHFSFFFSILLGEYNCQNRSWIFSFLCKYCPLGPRPRLTHTCVGLSQKCHGVEIQFVKDLWHHCSELRRVGELFFKLH